MAAALEMKDVTKLYHGTPAVKNVSFTLEPGEIHALLGENGAGKSTLTKMMAGVVTPTSGEILLDDKKIAFSNPAEALNHGIAMVFQETSLIPTLTVAQNLYLGKESLLNRLRHIYISAQQFFQSLNFAVDPTAMVSTLGAAQKQMVEIARAVFHKARIIIFDEPTASLTPEEKHHFFALIQRLKKDGVSIVFITHALEEALLIADRITVMRDGQHVVTDVTSAMNRDIIIKAMVGRSLSTELYGAETTSRTVRKHGNKVLSVQNLSMGRMVRNSSFSIYAGQVTGIFGLVGSGRTETAKVIAGILKRDLFHGGEILLEGESVRFRTPRPAVKKGVVYVTEDRKIEGFFETMSIGENVYNNILSADLEKTIVVNKSEIVSAAKTWIEALRIKAIGDARVIELSGGNQQKVVIARSLVQTPRLVIFDEPTRGVDVGAIADLHQIINELADSGLGVVVISSYLPEIIGLSDRILVSRQGRIVEEFLISEATEEKIMYAAVH